MMHNLKKKIKSYIKSYIKNYIDERFCHYVLNNIPGSIKSITNDLSQANGLAFLPHEAWISYNIKNIMAQFASDRINVMASAHLPSSPDRFNLSSKLSTQQDMESDWCRHWLSELHIPFCYHRKNWELGFVLQVLHEHDMFGKKGLGLACGNELLPSYLTARGCQITAGDKPLDCGDIEQKGWSETAQYTKSKESLYYAYLVDRDIFEANFTLAYIDMNYLPPDLNNTFDFCWSICAMEHLGSIRNGLDFLKNTLKLLKPGGISIHTTEFNIYSENETIDNCGSVLFQKKHFEKLSEIINKGGDRLYPINFDLGDGLFDRYVDMPLYPRQKIMGINDRVHTTYLCPHIKLLVGGFPATCAGVILQKNKE
ncbi:hypothetical protein FACS189460_5590 [Deltaproteobacteria bacterium]|nr:hypothetical protein FACS189460_5590 [Deltaproteobacteria bacterium]